DGLVTGGSVSNFLVRRVVRLSPPYLVTMLLVLMLHGMAVSSGWFPSPLDEPPTWGRVASHLIYAQDLLGFPNLSAGLWTVCIEIQFYVLFGTGLLVARRVWPVVTNGKNAVSPRVLAGLFAPLALMSLFVWCDQPSLEPHVIYFVGLFYLGMVTWWALDGRIPQGWYWATVGFFVARLLWQWKSEVMVGLVASLAIFTAGRSGHLHDWLNFRWLQYLGKISYSLYLIHYAVMHVVTHAVWAALGGSPSPMLAAAGLAIALVSSIGAAHLLYVWVEAPSSQWAARLKSAATTATVPETATATAINSTVSV
ncbi:MAG: acyltransferase, partial [Planctomycetota bacterium]